MLMMESPPMAKKLSSNPRGQGAGPAARWRQGSLQRQCAGRCRRLLLQSTVGARGSRQGFAVDLAVGCQGQGLQPDKGAGDHVVGQAVVQIAAQVGVLVTQDDIGDQAFVARRILACEHDSGLDGGMLAEQGFNLAEFDAEAAELDLVVDAAEELDVAIGQEAHEVTGLVEAARGKGVGNKLLSGQVWAIEVATRQAIATDV